MMTASTFDHEKLDCYRLANIASNIAEGNGKRSVVERARFQDFTLTERH